MSAGGKNKLLLSIIIPVFNAEKYIDSFLSKLLKNLPENSEIIVVENGSADHSFEKLQVYKDDITIIHTAKNFGVSHARNLGLEKARGEFFTFLDVDDDFEPKILAKMLKKIQQPSADLCIANYDEISEKSSKTTASKYNYETPDGDDLDLFLTDKIGPAVWDKIYRRETLGDIKFDESLAVGEDILYVLKILLQNPKTVFLDDIYYHYIQHKTSVMHTVNPHLLEFLDVPKKLSGSELEQLKNHATEWEFFQLEMYTRAIHSISNSYRSNHKTAKQYLQQIYDKGTLKQIQQNLFFPKSIRLEMSILRNFGIGIHLFLMPLYNIARRVCR